MGSRWLMKAFLQGTISLLPRRTKWNGLLQKYITRSHDPARRFDIKLTQASRHLETYIRTVPSSRVDDLRVLELGTGRTPIVPVAFYLAGVSEIYALDINGLCTRDDVYGVFRLFLDLEKDNLLEQQLPYLKRQRLANLDRWLEGEDSSHSSAAEMLAKCNIQYLIQDARNTNLPDSSIDLFTSNNVLEHIPPKDIDEILFEFGRLSAPGAFMSHFIDMADHYAHFDKSISVYNYLRYPSWAWWLLNNRLQYQNRLRMSDYRVLLSRPGWEIISEEQIQGNLEELRSVQIASEFSRYDENDLLTYTAWIACTRKPVNISKPM